MKKGVGTGKVIAEGEGQYVVKKYWEGLFDDSFRGASKTNFR